MSSFIWVFFGGGIGAMARFGISKIGLDSSSSFPIATFTANFISCIILGVLMAVLLKKGLDQRFQWLLMTGFCGGFSTFSTFSAETFKLIENGQMGIAIAYVLSSIVFCTLVLFGAYLLSIRFFG